MLNKYNFFDIAANLCDKQYEGYYFSEKKKHENDVNKVIERAKNYGVDKMLIVGGDYEDILKCLDICKNREGFTTTVGIHPCKAAEPFKNNQNLEEYTKKLDDLLQNNINKISAIGECGLDYDRLEWSTKEQQNLIFPLHFNLAEKYNLPMYLHSRNCEKDFIDILKQNRKKFSTGVVHSFTGSKEELKEIIDLDLYIGINGCSLKTEENINVLKNIPIDRIMLETDSPYCEIRNSHFSSQFVKTKFNSKPTKNYYKFMDTHLVKSRNEPCKIIQILEVVSKILNVSEDELAKTVYNTTCKIFKKL